MRLIKAKTAEISNQKFLLKWLWVLDAMNLRRLTTKMEPNELSALMHTSL